jgi:hypothetical protein
MFCQELGESGEQAELLLDLMEFIFQWQRQTMSI